MPASTLYLWFVKERELEPIVRELEEILGATRWYREHDNTWEWCETYADSKGHFFHFRRKRKPSNGDYDDPVRVTLRKKKGPFTDQEAQELADNIEMWVNSPVHVGKTEDGFHFA